MLLLSCDIYHWLAGCQVGGGWVPASVDNANDTDIKILYIFVKVNDFYCLEIYYFRL